MVQEAVARQNGSTFIQPREERSPLIPTSSILNHWLMFTAVEVHKLDDAVPVLVVLDKRVQVEVDQVQIAYWRIDLAELVVAVKKL